jgi:hypothetical protein
MADEQGLHAVPRGPHAQRNGLLLVSVLLTFAVQGTIRPGGVQQVLVSILLGVTLIAAFHVGHVSRRLIDGAILLGAAGVVVSVLRAVTGVVGDGEARVMNAVLVAFAPPAIALGVVRNLRATREVRLEAVTGVITLYMLLGFLFAFVYGALDRLGDAPFFANGTDATVSNCQYFSFTTLATIGYGDLTARTNFGHTLSVFEGLLGQIYLVTVVSLIVSNLGRRAGPRDPS